MLHIQIVCLRFKTPTRTARPCGVVPGGDGEGRGKIDKPGTIRAILDVQRRITRGLMPQAMESFRHLDVPLAQLKSLFIIATRGATNLSTLAEDLGVTPGNVTHITDRLVEQGLVSREPDARDRRIVRLGPTDKGRELLAGLMESHMGLMSEMLEDMSAEELDLLLSGLSGLVRAVEAHRQNLPAGAAHRQQLGG